MTDYGPRDSAGIRRRNSQPPIVLARLPRMGTALPAAPAPEPAPALDLREEIAQRIRLHVAEATSMQATSTQDASTHGISAHGSLRHDLSAGASHAEPTSYFSDRSHAQPPRSAPRAQSVGEQTRTERFVPNSTVTSPGDLSAKVFQLHEQLAPLAGLIVTMALIVSAGLLYWMIVVPARAPLPGYAPQNSAPQDAALQDADFRQERRGGLTDSVTDVAQPRATTAAPDQWIQMELAKPRHISNDFYARQPPTPPAAPEPLVVEPVYPSTRFAALDFAKLPMSDVQRAATSEEPAIAARPGSSQTRY